MELLVSWLGATLVVALFIFSTTFPRNHHLLRWIRLILAYPALKICWSAAYPSSVVPFIPIPAGNVEVFVGGAYLISRVLEICIIGFWEEGEALRPRWLIRKESGDKGEIRLIAAPPPSTLRERIEWTADNLLSVRGCSSYQDRTWSWAPKYIRNYCPTSRTRYLLIMSLTTAGVFLIHDACGAILRRQAWNLATPHTLTTLPVLQQIFYSFTCGLAAWSGNELAFGQPRGLVFVGLLGLSPSSFPPVFDGIPLGCGSLSELWSARWHQVFRRSFERLSLPATWIMDWATPSLNRRVENLIRAIVIFALSSVVHWGISHAASGVNSHIKTEGIEFEQVKFFMVQPFGLLIESTLVNPMSERLPGKWKSLVRRIFMWAWIVWTGRWISNWFIHLDMFRNTTLGFSAVEALMEYKGYGTIGLNQQVRV